MIAMTRQNTTTMITEDEAREIYPDFRYDDLPVFVGDIVLHTIHEDDQETEWYMDPIDCTETKGTITELELRAVALVNVAERIADPVNKYDIARGAVKLAGKVARFIRK